jgi:hypothetical protein
MNGKQAKRCRAKAYRYAQEHDLWHKGEEQVFSGFKGFFRKLIKPWRIAWLDRVSLWYKRNLKSLARQAYAWLHSGGPAEAEYLARKRARVNRKFRASLHKSPKEAIDA